MERFSVLPLLLQLTGLIFNHNTLFIRAKSVSPPLLLLHLCLVVCLSVSGCLRNPEEGIDGGFVLEFALDSEAEPLKKG